MENEMKISPGHYDVNGRKQGIWIEYTTDNGKRIMERGSYDEGVRYGEWKRYDLTYKTPQEIKEEYKAKKKKNWQRKNKLKNNTKK